MSQPTHPTGRRPAVIALLVAGVATAVLFSTRPRQGDHPPRPPVETWPVVDPLDSSEGIRLCAVRVAARRIVIRDVIAGRTTVAEAAAVFAALNELPPHSPFYASTSPVGPASVSATDDRLVLGLQVVHWITAIAEEDDSDEARAMAAAVEQEVRAGGLAALPAVRDSAYRELLAAADAEVAAARPIPGPSGDVAAGPPAGRWAVAEPTARP